MKDRHLGASNHSDWLLAPGNTVNQSSNGSSLCIIWNVTAIEKTP